MRTKLGGIAGATTLVLSAGVIGTGAASEAVASEDIAPTSGAAFDALAQELLADDAAEAVLPNSRGEIVLYVTSPEQSLEESAEAFVENHSNVVVEQLDAPFVAQAATDVVGGIGYSAIEEGQPGRGNCTIGFAAWTPDGDPAMISAGHCTKDGTRQSASLPTGAPLGELGFSQYGGPGNTPGTFGEPGMTDISVWDITNPDIALRPEVTDWTVPDSPAASATPITAVGEATLGPIEKSGRTTGRTPGVVVGTNGWASVGGRMVYGFLSSMESKGGDSGSPMHQAGTAVGIASSTSTVNGVPHTWAANLQAGLALTGGYTVALAVEAPVLSSPTEIDLGDEVTGTGAAGAALVVSPVGGEQFEVEIEGNGEWSFDAPEAPGVYDYVAFVRSGFDQSEETRFQIQVRPAAPSLVSPVDGERVENDVTEIAGLGHAGATVELTGDVTGSAIVGADGTWTWAAGLGIGEYDVTVRQSINGVTSLPRAVSFAVTAPTTAPDGGVDGGGVDGGDVDTGDPDSSAADNGDGRSPASAATPVVAGDGADGLAETGGAGNASVLVSALGLLAVGAALLLSLRRGHRRIPS
ncbi:MAG: S1 family peptidase [Actinomycetota bacterium]